MKIKFSELESEITMFAATKLVEAGYINIAILTNGNVTFENEDGQKFKMRAIRFTLMEAD